MKLMTHNMLMSPGTRNGFPLAIEVEKMEVVEAEFNADFCARMIEKLEWAALVATVASVRATRNSSRNSFAAHHAHAQPHRRSRATLRAAQLKLEKGEELREKDEQLRQKDEEITRLKLAAAAVSTPVAAPTSVTSESPVDAADPASDTHDAHVMPSTLK